MLTTQRETGKLLTAFHLYWGIVCRQPANSVESCSMVPRRHLASEGVVRSCASAQWHVATDITPNSCERVSRVDSWRNLILRVLSRSVGYARKLSTQLLQNLDTTSLISTVRKLVEILDAGRRCADELRRCVNTAAKRLRSFALGTKTKTSTPDSSVVRNAITPISASMSRIGNHPRTLDSPSQIIKATWLSIDRGIRSVWQLVSREKSLLTLAVEFWSIAWSWKTPLAGDSFGVKRRTTRIWTGRITVQTILSCGTGRNRVVRESPTSSPTWWSTTARHFSTNYLTVLSSLYASLGVGLSRAHTQGGFHAAL